MENEEKIFIENFSTNRGTTKQKIIFWIIFSIIEIILIAINIILIWGLIKEGFGLAFFFVVFFTLLMLSGTIVISRQAWKDYKSGKIFSNNYFSFLKKGLVQAFILILVLMLINFIASIAEKISKSLPDSNNNEQKIDLNI